jgi:hypothetical protein
MQAMEVRVQVCTNLLVQFLRAHPSTRFLYLEDNSGFLRGAAFPDTFVCPIVVET